jgi:hypothetical protein
LNRYVARTATARRAALACAGAVLAFGAAATTAPAAQAATARPSEPVSLVCFSEGHGSLTFSNVQCSLNAAAPYTTHWSFSGGTSIISGSNSSVTVGCYALHLVTVTATVTDAAGVTTTASQSTTCIAGVVN